MQTDSVRRNGLGPALMLACLIALPGHHASAQGGLLFQGLADVELWKTDSASRLLARGGGRPSALGRITTWAAIEPIRNLVFFGQVQGEAGSARDDEGNELYFERAGVRFLPSDALTIEVGKSPPIVGTFSSRELSFRNPLISAPDGYYGSYPVGARIDGDIGMVDYRAGIVSLPVYRSGYTPSPSATMRPAIGGGITPFVGLRIGASATAGPYLNTDLTASQLGGNDWTSYKQRIIAGDAALSRGYFEGHAEVTHSSYDVPGKSSASTGLAYYLEAKYTFTPRIYFAARYERNDYPFISPITQTVWIASNSAFSDVELGGGYRATATSLVKLTVRADHWTPNPNPQAPHDNGYAVAIQWSQFLDFVDLATRRQ